MNRDLSKRRKRFKKGRIRMKIIEVNNPILRKSILKTMKKLGADKDLLKKAAKREITKEELKVWFDEQRSRIRKRDRKEETEVQMEKFKAIAEKAGCPVAEIIRRAMDEWLEKYEKKERIIRREVKPGKSKQSRSKGGEPLQP